MWIREAIIKSIVLISCENYTNLLVLCGLKLISNVCLTSQRMESPDNVGSVNHHELHYSWQRFTWYCSFIHEKICYMLLAGVWRQFRKTPFWFLRSALIQEVVRESLSCESFSGFQLWQYRNVTVIPATSRLPLHPSHPQGQIQFHPDSEEWGGGGGCRTSCLAPLSEGPPHFTLFVGTTLSWELAKGHQEPTRLGADHILRIWLSPRTAGQTAGERKDIPSVDCGKDLLRLPQPFLLPPETRLGPSSSQPCQWASWRPPAREYRPSWLALGGSRNFR